jgi:WD40 repeat protein
MRLWDAETRRALKVLSGHAGYVKDVAFSPDGKQALSAGSDGTVRLWDIDSGKVLKRFTAHDGAVVAAVFAPGSNVALSGSRDAVVKVWDLAKPAATSGQ